MSRAWSRHDDPERAVDRILEGADRAFCELGVSRAGMSEIARFAGCSRGTLYRYFPTRHDLHVAYVDRAAAEIGARVRDHARAFADPGERLVEGILAALRQVRSRPGTVAWFEAGAAGTATRMSRASEVVDTIAQAFVAELLGPRRSARGGGRAEADWLVRVILSFLSNPGRGEAEERMLVQRFVVPGLLLGGREGRAPRQSSMSSSRSRRRRAVTVS